MTAYKNTNTGDVVVYDGPHPELDALDNWEVVDDSQITDAARNAYARAAAEQAMIEQAQRHRFDKTSAAAEGAVNGEAVRSQTLPGLPPPTPTAAHFQVEGTGDQPSVLADKSGGGQYMSPEEAAEKGAWDVAHPPTDGVLARAKADHKSGATQVGDDTEAAPGKPVKSARKPELVAYAVASGELSEAEASELTRDELAERFAR